MYELIMTTASNGEGGGGGAGGIGIAIAVFFVIIWLCKK